MSASADKIRAKVDAGEELEAGLMAEIKEALDTADLLAENRKCSHPTRQTGHRKRRSEGPRLREAKAGV